MGKRCVYWPIWSICLSCSAWAAASGLVAVLPVWDSAYVSGTVTSQAIGFRLAHGKRVVPSGRLLSSRIRLIGSLTAGIWACLISLRWMPFKWLWHCCLGALLRQDSPCSPRASTALPHTRVCGSQTYYYYYYYYLSDQHKTAGRKTRLDIQNYGCSGNLLMQGRLRHINDGANAPWKNRGKVLQELRGEVRKLFVHFPLSFCSKFPLQN